MITIENLRVICEQQRIMMQKGRDRHIRECPICHQISFNKDPHLYCPTFQHLEHWIQILDWMLVKIEN